jgi:hypothetical protein
LCLSARLSIIGSLLRFNRSSLGHNQDSIARPSVAIKIRSLVFRSQVRLWQQRLEASERAVRDRDEAVLRAEGQAEAERQAAAQAGRLMEQERAAAGELLSAARAEAREREAAVKGLEVEVERLRALLALQKGKLIDLVGQLDAARQAEVLLREQARQAEARLREELEGCRASCEEAGALIRSMQHELDALSGLVKLRDADAAALTARVAEAAQMEEGLRRELERAGAELRAETERLEGRLREGAQEVEALREGALERERAAARQAEEILDLQARLAAAARAEQALRALDEEKEGEWAAQRERLQEEAEGLERRLREREEEARGLMSRLGEAEGQVLRMIIHDVHAYIHMYSSTP